MKKIVLLLLMCILATTMVYARGVREAAPVIEDEPVIVQEAITEEPVPETTEVAQPSDAVVVSEAPSAALDSGELDNQFSYVYGYLLSSSIANQGILLNSRLFVQGSTDFYNYNDPLISEDVINEIFVKFQDYLDGNLSEEELYAVPVLEDGTEDLSIFDKFSYGYGYLIMFNLQSQGLVVVIDQFSNGVTDALAGIPLAYTDEQIDALFTAYQQKMESEYAAAFEQFAAENLAMAEAFLGDNAQNAGVVTTGSGLQYEVVLQGDGELPLSTDTVSVDYMITFLDGTTGDNSYSRGEPSEFALSSLIPGFTEGVLLMPVGSHYRFYLHPDLAYGPNGTEAIPPNALLIFDVELHSIVK